MRAYHWLSTLFGRTPSWGKDTRRPRPPHGRPSGPSRRIPVRPQSARLETELLELRLAPSINTVTSFFAAPFNPQAGLIEDRSGDLFGTTNGGYGAVFEVPYDSTTHSYGLPVTLVQFNLTNGANPVAGLVEDSSGNLFGTTEYGGASGDGTVFEVPYNSNTQAYGSVISLVTFNYTNGAHPQAGLIEDSSGNLFGTTQYGGGSDSGTAFEVRYDSSTQTYGQLATLVSFNPLNGANPLGGLVEDSNSNLFGTTYAGGTENLGTVFELPYNSNTQTYGSLATLVDFDNINGGQPNAGLVEDSSGNLFGTDSSSVFEVPYNSTTHTYGMVTTLANLPYNKNGANPLGGLVEDSNGNLFGTTYNRGTSYDGTVFEVPYISSSHTYGSLTTLVNFNDTNGQRPEAGLVEDSSGNLFGTTFDGGTAHYGTVFEVPYNSSTKTYGTLATLVNFSNGAIGENCEAGLVEDSSGNLFGSTLAGGTFSAGTVFELPYNSTTQPYGSLITLLPFNLTYGWDGQVVLIEPNTGNLFGIAGVSTGNYGTVFEIPYNSNSHTYGSLTTLVTFNAGTNGAYPSGGLVEDSSGNLFGTTDYGGTSDDGTLFEIPYNSSSHAYGSPATLVNFHQSIGEHPLGRLVLDSSGNLFGTTWFDGTVFELPYNSSSHTYGSLATLADFSNGTNGDFPQAGLVEDSSGNLFGTTTGGGTSDYGTVFEVPYNSSSHAYGSLITLVNFNQANGATPYAELVEDSGGNLFGTTSAGGTSGYGTVFEVPYNSSSHAYGSLITLVNFNQANGANPYAGLVEDSSGNFFGTTNGGGTWDVGTVFVLSAPNSPIQFTTMTLANGTVNMAGYAQTIMATGGAGSLVFSTTGTLPAGLTLSSSGVLSGMPIQAGSYTFTVMATDVVGASASQSYTITIKASPVLTSYQINIAGSGTVQAGAGFLVTVQAVDQYGDPITSYSGPASATATISPASAASNFPTTVAINSRGLGLFLANIPTAGTYTITVANPSAPGFTGSTGPVTVTPGPAVKLGFGNGPANTSTGDLLPAVSVQVEDLYGNVVTEDNSDTVAIGVGSGPGGFTSGSTLTASVHNGVATFNNLALVTPGTYQLSAVVPGLYTGPTSTSFTVLPLQVVPGTFQGTPSGFWLQLNAPMLVNSMTPALYGSGTGASGSLTPTVTLTQITGTPPLGRTLPYQVPGSLIVNPATNTLTFLETNTARVVNTGSPLLPHGVYVAHITSSGANGLQALHAGGSYLDGTNSGTPGHDFTATFTVGAAGAGDTVVWLPATADGPGQGLSAPGANRRGDGYPVYLDSAGGVASVQATINYNPALLTAMASSTATFTVTVPSPGTAVIRYNGPTLAAGVQTPIGFLTAAVPSGTPANPVPYKVEDLLHLTSVTLNGTSSGVAACDGLHVVAYVGDADGNAVYNSADALLIRRVTLQTDSGFAAFPLVDPVIVADTDGAGFIPADAALQVNEAGVGMPAPNLPIPPIPGGVVIVNTVLAPQAARPASAIAAITSPLDRATPVAPRPAASAIAWFLPRRHRILAEVKPLALGQPDLDTSALDLYFAHG